jgi:hypothetical protein
MRPLEELQGPFMFLRLFTGGEGSQVSELASLLIVLEHKRYSPDFSFRIMPDGDCEHTTVHEGWLCCQKHRLTTCPYSI